ncbi:hypothetical protein [Spirosoma koreense]
MEEKVLTQLRWLKIYTFTTSAIFSLYLFTAFNPSNAPKRFEEIDVERINVVEKDGTLKMVISNEAKQHPGIVDGKVMAPRKRSAGIIFFNREGDECGGLVYEGTKKRASLALSIDQYKNDQLMQLQYDEKLDGKQRARSYGLKLWDRPDNFTLGQLVNRLDSLEKLNNETLYKKGIADLEAKRLLGKERLFVGKTYRSETGVFIRDEAGNARIKLYVDRKGEAKIEFLDAAGKLLPLR